MNKGPSAIIYSILAVAALLIPLEGDRKPERPERPRTRPWGSARWGSGAQAVAVGGAGNVYVTGNYTDSDYEHVNVTIKYDKQGHELWVKKHAASVEALALSRSGHIYVTGGFTAKYGAGGKEIWSKDCVAPGKGSAYAKAIALDGSENVYITGNIDAPGAEPDFLTIKYDTNGNQQWVQRYDGPKSHSDYAQAIAVDGSGNVHVTGESADRDLADYATVKYGPNGKELWARRYNGSKDFGLDLPRAIAVDGADNVYVTGYSNNPGSSDSAYATLKYDADGGLLWIKRYDGLGNWTDDATSLALDGSGHIYVTGSSYGKDRYCDFATIKYDANGRIFWVRRCHWPGRGASALTLDASGFIYVTGSNLGRGTGYDYVTIKYDTGGERIWMARYDGSPHLDIPNAIAVDGSGNVIVTGSSHGDFATVKYGPKGTQLWAKRYPATTKSATGFRSPRP